jgi:hypothetical protein
VERRRQWKKEVERRRRRRRGGSSSRAYSKQKQCTRRSGVRRRTDRSGIQGDGEVEGLFSEFSSSSPHWGMGRRGFICIE